MPHRERISLNSEVKSLAHQFGAVTVSVGPVGGGATFDIRFEDVFGVRILDGGDSLALTRTEVCREFLVSGCDDCVNVLAFETPVVTQVKAVTDEHA